MEEGELRTVKEVCIRKQCENCTNLAEWRITFLLDSARSNPASTAYMKDDCTWCSDRDVLVCHECRSDAENHPPNGYGMCSAFPHAKFPKMFLEWKDAS